MICPICRDTNATWQNVDAFRSKEEGMSLCSKCGFTSYPGRYKSKAEIIEYYKKEYRQAPNIGNIYSGERKIQFHAHFLSELMDKWREGNKSLVVTDIGSAFGLFLNWWRHQLPNSEVTGVELTTSYVRNAWHLFQIKSLPEFDTSKKYDLIASYKSLEHILDPDIELQSYIDCLKDDGYLYISVPLWFDDLRNFGNSGFDLEYYYSPNHINTWTRKHFEGLLKACGGEVVKENHTYYNATYLVKRNDSLKTADRSAAFEDPEKIKDHMRRIFAANEAFQIGQYDKAIEAWPNFPLAWTSHYEHARKSYHDLGFEKIYTEFCQKALAACNEDADIHFLIADICARYDEYEKAIKHLNVTNKLRPNQPHIFSLLSNSFRAMGKAAKEPADKIKFFEQSRQCAKIMGEVASQCKGEAMTWMMFDNANIPTPFEV